MYSEKITTELLNNCLEVDRGCELDGRRWIAFVFCQFISEKDTVTAVAKIRGERDEDFSELDLSIIGSETKTEHGEGYPIDHRLTLKREGNVVTIFAYAFHRQINQVFYDFELTFTAN